MVDIRELIATQVVELPGDEVKSLVLSWLVETGGSLPDFQRLLDRGVESAEDELEYGMLNERLGFVPLTEEEQIQQSLDALEEYRRTGNGVPHEQVREWLDSIGTENEIQCPR
jgi:predicted transcriptional regulator